MKAHDWIRLFFPYRLPSNDFFFSTDLIRELPLTI